MAHTSARAFGAITIVALAAAALPLRAAMTLPGTVVERGAPARIATCSADADEVSFVPHVAFADGGKRVTTATVLFTFVDQALAPLVSVAVETPVGRSALPTFPAGATAVTCALESAKFADGSRYAFTPAAAAPSLGGIVGGAAAAGAAAAIFAGRRGSGAAAPGTPGVPATAPTVPVLPIAPTSGPTPIASFGPPALPTPIATLAPPPFATPFPVSSVVPPFGPPVTPAPGRTASPAPLATSRAGLLTPPPALPPARPTPMRERDR